MFFVFVLAFSFSFSKDTWYFVFIYFIFLRFDELFFFYGLFSTILHQHHAIHGVAFNGTVGQCCCFVFHKLIFKWLRQKANLLYFIGISDKRNVLLLLPIAILQLFDQPFIQMDHHHQSQQFIHLFIHSFLRFGSSKCLSVCPYFYLFIWISVCPFVCLFVPVSIGLRRFHRYSYSCLGIYTYRLYYTSIKNLTEWMKEWVNDLRFMYMFCI